jgi:hypothetical protein
MADVRVNGKRIPPLQTVNDMATLIKKLESLANQNNSALTNLMVNNSNIDIDNKDYYRMKLENDDTVEAKFDTPEKLSFESLQVALDMADLLILDLKLATLKIWENDKIYEKSLETLLEDCNLFLSLAAKPIYLLNKNPHELNIDAQNCLQELDKIANHVEDATLLAVHGRNKDSCYVLVGMVKSSIERWIGLSAIFAESLNINNEQDENLLNKQVLKQLMAVS